LEGLKNKYPVIGDVRGMGLIQAMELVKDRASKEPAPQETTQLMEEARREGLLIGKGGLWGNVIRMSPPLNISKADVDEAIRLLDRALAAVEKTRKAAVSTPASATTVLAGNPGPGKR
jgi:4-aminobutyrate aminotransferase-like enzyme